MKQQILINNIICPTLLELSRYKTNCTSHSAVNLLFGTCCVESNLCEYVRQIGFDLKGIKGAFGIYQMEKRTHDDILDKYISFRPKLKELIFKKFRDERIPGHLQLVSDPFYATAMCRIHYMRISEELPHPKDVDGMAKYWKKYYNTDKGKGKEKDFITKFNKYGSELQCNLK